MSKIRDIRTGFLAAGTAESETLPLTDDVFSSIREDVTGKDTTLLPCFTSILSLPFDILTALDTDES